jgi:RHS repeat-associated protein
VTTTYTLDLNAGLTQVLSATDSQQPNPSATTYLYGPTRIGEQQPAGFAYHLPDALGSVRQLANASGAVTLTRSYEPFGSTLSSAGVGTTAFQFAGEARDATGLVFLRARYFSTASGRFITTDPVDGSADRPMSFHLYQYAYANPILYQDSSGKAVCLYGRDPVTGACNPSPWGSILPPGLAQVARPSISLQDAVGTLAFAVICYVGWQLFKDAVPQTQVSPIERLYILPEIDPEQQPTVQLGPDIIVRPTGTPEPDRLYRAEFMDKFDFDWTWRPRGLDKRGGMSFFDSIENLRLILKGPSRVFSIPRGKLSPPSWLVINDETPPGHVSVRRADDAEWSEWHAYYNKGYPGGSEYGRIKQEHRFTMELQSLARFEGIIAP